MMNLLVRLYKILLENTVCLCRMLFRQSIQAYTQKKRYTPSLGLYLFKRENFCPF